MRALKDPPTRNGNSCRQVLQGLLFGTGRTRHSPEDRHYHADVDLESLVRLLLGDPRLPRLPGGVGLGAFGGGLEALMSLITPMVLMTILLVQPGQAEADALVEIAETFFDRATELKHKKR